MIIVGAGGHAKDLLTILGKWPERNFVFFDNFRSVDTFVGYKILKSTAEVVEHFGVGQDYRFAIAVGGVKNRMTLSDLFENIRGIPASVISENAIIGDFQVELGPGVNIMHNTFISNCVSV